MPLVSVFKETRRQLTTDKHISVETRSALLPLESGATVGMCAAISKTITILERAFEQG